MKIDIPGLCFGDEVRTVGRHEVVDLGSGEVLGTLSQIVGARIGADCIRKSLPRKALRILQRIPVRERIRMSILAADYFEQGVLDCGGVPQSIDDYHTLLCRTSGLPITLARNNTGRIAAALRKTPAIIDGLSRGLPLDIFDTGLGEQGGSPVRLIPRIDALGCCMPNNSPGVHFTWIICLAFGIPVLIRPGSSEPFTPWRLIQAFIKAGFPKEIFGYYPCDHGAANRIPELTRGAIVFGSDDNVQRWASYPLVQVHGSGFSKLIIGEDRIDDWEALIPELVENVAANSGRSCFAVSRIIVPRHAGAIAAAMSSELAKLVPLPWNDPAARLSAMAMPKAAEGINAQIDELLKVGDTLEPTAPFHEGGRLVKFEGRTYLLPTLVVCAHEHPLASQEFLFPFSAIVQASNDEAFEMMGSTLSLAVYTHDEALKARALRSLARLVSINKGTSLLDRTQPHEENLFELLYQRFSFVQ